MPERRAERDHTGRDGGDRVLDCERETILPGEDPGTIDDLPDDDPATAQTQVEQQQARDLATGKENPG